ncbi:MAG: hypothetical protein IJO27_03185 [Bacilli bacterium]|nr:hypothetical protein [Bacilli bacterium]
MGNNIPCQSRRTFFDLFKLYSCENCKLLVEEEYYNIGDINVNIYYIERCILNKDNNEVIESKKLNLFLKDAIFHSYNNVIVWLEKFDYQEDEELLFDLLSFDLDIQIIV